MTQQFGQLNETASQTGGPYVHIGLAPLQAGFEIFETNFGNVLVKDGTPVPGLSGVVTAAPILFEAFDRLDGTTVPLRAAPTGAKRLDLSRNRDTTTMRSSRQQRSITV